MGVFTTKEVMENDESSFCENAEALGSLTYGDSLPVEEATFTFNQERIADRTRQNRQNERRPGYLGERTCEVSLTFPWYGHNTAATGALASTDLYELVQKGLGGTLTSGAGTTVGASPGAADLDATVVDHGIYIIGSKGDGGGDGQAVWANGTDGTLHTACPAAPSQSDVVYGTLLAYPTENPTTTKRFALGFADGGIQHHALGCQLSSLNVNIPIGGKPTITLTYQGAYWGGSSETVAVPSANSLELSNWAPVAGGQMFHQTAGTTTHATINPSAINLNIDLGLSPVRGASGSVGTYQVTTGWQRTMAKASLSVTVPWADYETFFRTHADETADSEHKTIMFNNCPTAGRAVGFCLPRCYAAGQSPSNLENVEDQQYVTVNYEAREHTTTTSDLTRAPFRLFFG